MSISGVVFLSEFVQKGVFENRRVGIRPVVRVGSQGGHAVYTIGDYTTEADLPENWQPLFIHHILRSPYITSFWGSLRPDGLDKT